MPSSKSSSPPRAGRAGDPWFEIRESPIAGRGAFATRPIRKGTRFGEYTGERIDQAEADERYDDDSMDEHHTFLFILDNDVILDAAVGGNDSRYINHSCEPNCDAVIEDGRIWIEAIKPIKPGEELTYDYAYERNGPFEESWLDLYACRCGAPGCRGTILKWVREGRRRFGIKRALKEARERAAKRAAKRAANRAASRKAAAKKTSPKRATAKTATRKAAQKRSAKRARAR